MKTIRLFPLLLLLLLVPTNAHAQQTHWKRCVTASDNTHCTRFPVHRRSYGTWHACRHVLPHVRVCVTHPLYRKSSLKGPVKSQISGYATSLLVTGYSWGCGATGLTASGQAPYVGGAAADVAQFPFGTHIAIAGLETVAINDTGGDIGWGHLDAMMPSCGAAINWGARVVPVTVYR